MEDASLRQRSDNELVELTKKNSEYFGVLMSRYEDALFRYVRRISHFSPEDIEDILQEAFIKAYQNIYGYDTSAKFSSWLYRIVHNQTVDAIRKNRAFIFSLDESDMIYFLKSSINVEREVFHKQCLDKAQDSIKRLPFKYREILILRFLEEKTYEEMMDILKKPKGSIATIINRGRKMLLKELRKEQSDCFKQ